MTIGRFLYLFSGILLIYAIISGFHFSYSNIDGITKTTGGYSPKFGLIFIGILLFYLGYRVSKKQNEENNQSK